MELIKILKTLLIIITPLLIFLSAIQFAGFNDSFYKKEFSKYKVQENVPEALELHKNVMGFISGKSDYLPGNFNDREKKHLWDVRMLILLSKAVFYLSAALAGTLAVLSVRKIRKRKNLEQFIGTVLLFGGLSAIALSALLFLSVNSNFSSSFESFHKIFFQAGTYSFDPENEIIVNIYPEGMFMDLGLGIAKFVTLASFIFIAAGMVILLRGKKIK